MTFEVIRGLLEDIEVIEDSITSRIQRNPEIWYEYLEATSKLNGKDMDAGIAENRKHNRIYRTKKYLRSRKQVKTQQYEINVFLDDIFNKNKKVLALRSQLQDEHNKLLDPNRNFESFDQMLKGIEEKYSGDESVMDLDIDGKVRYYSMFPQKDKLLSERTGGAIDITQYFKRDENFGLILDLENVYREWFNVVQGTDETYLTFLGKLKSFEDDDKYALEPIMDRKNVRYCEFLKKTCDEIEEMFFRTNILINKDQSISLLRKQYLDSIHKPKIIGKKGEFCVICGKWFKTHGVYSNHLKGKLHVKNDSKFNEAYLAEFKLHVYLKAMTPSLQNTIDYVERKMAYTNNERIEDSNKLNETYMGAIYDPAVEQEGDYKEDDKKNKSSTKYDDLTTLLGSSADMPLGPDGLPIPFWLYKMQGLDVSHECEICGNLQYKGHKNFEKHFNGATHKYHLKCLGIEPSSAFNGITSISEAQTLWKKMQSVDGTAINQTSEIKEEVEDPEGNVMTKDLYAELKKQGLV